MAESIWEIIQGLYLICSLLHIFVTSLGYLIALLYVIVHRPKRLIPSLVTIAITSVIIIFFWNVFANLSIVNLFNGNRWPSDLFQNWPIFFVVDPLLLIFVIWFKLACSIDAFRFIPTRPEVERFRDEYEAAKGHRDFVVIYCLRGDEPQKDSLASIRAAINSKFPPHRLRILLLFYGDYCSVLDRFLRTHLAPEPLDSSSDNAPLETFVAANGVKISVLRMIMTSLEKANLRCLDFLSMAYEEDKLRKPIVCFLKSTIVLDEMAIARFVYEFDDPRREFITGLLLQSDDLYATNKLLCSKHFWVRIQTSVAEDYCGNMTRIRDDFLVARFKALKAVASQAFIESDVSKFMQNHQLSMCLIKAKATRHRVGICLGALARPASSAVVQPFIKQLRHHAINLIEVYEHNAEMILECHIWKTTPLLGLLLIGSSILESHIYFFMQLFLLERSSGRGSALASSYIFLLLVPSYLFSAFAGSRYGDNFAAITVFVNFLLKPLIDIVADVTICTLFVKRYIWERYLSKSLTDARATSELTTAQKVV